MAKRAKRASKAKKTEMVVTSETLGPERVESFLPDDEPAPEEQPAKPERLLLQWQEGESEGTWVARGLDGDEYLIDESDDRVETSYWPKRADPVSKGGKEEGLWQNPWGCDTPEEAKELCQWHVDTRLRWREEEPGAVWQATSVALAGQHEYACVATVSPAEGYEDTPATWHPQHGTDGITGIGAPTTLELAKETCQDHHRQQHPPPTPGKAPDEKPKRELDEWVIGRPPSVELRAELALKQAKTSEEIEELENELAREEREFRATKKRIEKEISEIRGRQKSLAVEVRHGMSAKVRCWRERVGDEWVYTDEAGAELDRQPAADGLQQKLVGDRTVPKDPPSDNCNGEPADECVIGGGECEPDTCPVAVGERAARGQLPADLDLRPTKAWRPVEGSHPDGSRKVIYYAGDPDGEHYAHWHDMPKKSGGSGLWYLTFTGPVGTREIGRHASGQSARTCAHTDNQTRLRWREIDVDDDGIAHVLQSECGNYMINRCHMETHDGIVSWAVTGLCLLEGEQGETVGETHETSADVTLGDATILAEADCQRHADERRAA